jgi:hypothetical protein
MNEFEEPKILIVKDKHFTYHFKVTSKMDLHKKCVKLLKSRMDAGYYDFCNYNVIIDSDIKILSATIKELQCPIIKGIINARLESSKIAEKETNKHNRWLKYVSEIINMEVWDDNQYVHHQTAYQLLSERSRHEYEFVELVGFDDFEQFLKDSH